MATDRSHPVGFLLNRIAQEIRERTAAVLKPLGIGPRHYGLMRHLHVSGPMSQRRLGELHRTDRTTIVALLDDLETLGLVRRAADAEDRRRHAVTLSAAGRALYAKAARQVGTVERQFIASLSASEARHFCTLLENMLANVTAGQEPAAPTGDKR